MNWTNLEGNWNEVKGKVKTTWGRLTDDDLTQAAGHKERLVGMIQQRYGIAREKAEEQLDEFISAGENWIAKAKEGAHEVVEKGKEIIEKGKEAVEKGKEAVEKGKDYVQNTTFSKMAGDLKDLIGRHPVHCAVLGVGLGFLIGRLMTSSNRS